MIDIIYITRVFKFDGEKNIEGRQRKQDQGPTALRCVALNDKFIRSCTYCEPVHSGTENRLRNEKLRLPYCLEYLS